MDELLYLFNNMFSGEFQTIAINNRLSAICGESGVYGCHNIWKWIINTLSKELEEFEIKKLFQIRIANKLALYLPITKNKSNNMVVVMSIYNDQTEDSYFNVFYIKIYQKIKDLVEQIGDKYDDIESNENIKLFF